MNISCLAYYRILAGICHNEKIGTQVFYRFLYHDYLRTKNSYKVERNQIEKNYWLGSTFESILLKYKDINHYTFGMHTGLILIYLFFHNRDIWNQWYIYIRVGLRKPHNGLGSKVWYKYIDIAKNVVFISTWANI